MQWYPVTFFINQFGICRTVIPFSSEYGSTVFFIYISSDPHHSLTYLLIFHFVASVFRKNLAYFYWQEYNKLIL